MKIVPTIDGDVESSLCDVDRMAEVLHDILVSLGENNAVGEVPDSFMKQVDLAVLVGSHLKEMISALKVEFYAEFEERMVSDRARKVA